MRLAPHSVALLASLAVLEPTQSIADTKTVSLAFSGRLLIDGDASRYGTLSVDCVVVVPLSSGGRSVTTFSSGTLFRDGVAQVPVDANGYVTYEINADVRWDIGTISDDDIEWTCTAQNNGPGMAMAVVHPTSDQIKAPSVEGTIGGHAGVIRSGSGEAVVVRALPSGN